MKKLLFSGTYILTFFLLLTLIIIGCKKKTSSTPQGIYPGYTSTSSTSGITGGTGTTGGSFIGSSTGGGTTGSNNGCPTTAACGCSSKKMDECDASPCCKWTSGKGCRCR